MHSMGAWQVGWLNWTIMQRAHIEGVRSKQDVSNSYATVVFQLG